MVAIAARVPPRPAGELRVSPRVAERVNADYQAMASPRRAVEGGKGGRSWA